MPANLPPDEGGRLDWRRIAISGYGPTLLSSIGFGAVIPLISLSALHLGASVGMAAFITALLGVGQLVGDLPAGVLAARIGEKRAMVAACLFDAAALTMVYLAHSLPALGIAVFLDGISGAVFGLARQTYLTEAIPLRFRARALSTLGGVFLVGFFLGPLIGAWIISQWAVTEAFVFAACMSLLAAVVTMALPDLPDSVRPSGTRPEPVSMREVLWAHRRVFATQGLGVLMIMTVRSARQAIIPLWCSSQGISDVWTSLIYAISMACDVALFFPGGAIMDRFGRWWVSVPSMVAMGVGMAVLPFTHTALAIAVVAGFLGVGNGISSGIVMTLGADASPAVGRAQFLAGWRLFGDLGNSVGPLVITGITALAPLAAAAGVLGAVAFGGAAWLARWVPRRAVGT